MTADDLKQLHPSDVVLWLHVEKAVWRFAAASGAKVWDVRPTTMRRIGFPDGTTGYGYCTFYGRGKNRTHGIEITLRRFSKAGGWDRRRVCEWTLLDSICHELAHAKTGWSDEAHGPKFFHHFGKNILLAEKINIRRDILAAGVKLPL